MKKFLLTFPMLLCMLLFCGSAMAEDVTTTFAANAADAKWTAGQQLNCADGGLTWVTSGKPNAFDSANGRGVQFSKTSSDLTTTVTGKVYTVTVVASSNGTGNKMTVTVGNVAFGTETEIAKSNNQTYTFSSNAGASGEVKVSLISDEENGKSIYVKSITLSYDAASGGDTPATDAITIAEAQAAATGTQVTVVGTCMAQTKTGAVLADGTGIIFHFVNDTDAPSYKIGDQVSITGKLAEYGGFKQFSTKNDATTTVTVLKSGSVNYPEATTLDAAGLDAWAKTPALQYVKVTGVLNISGNYYNLNVEGATAVGSIVKPTDDLTTGLVSGSTVTVTGYAIYTSGSGKYVNIVAAKISVDGAVEDVDISNTPETAYSVSKAIELVKEGKGLDHKVYVKGTITGTPSVAVSYGNANYNIKGDGDETLYIYRGFDLGNVKFTAEDQIKEGDQVVIYGQLTTYNDTPQMGQGNYLYSLNGATERAAAAIEKPAFGLNAGTYLVDEALTLTITCATEGAKIMYTIDGEDADENDYSAALSIKPGTHTVKAVAETADGSARSSEVTATYTVSQPAALAFSNGDFEAWGEKIPTGWTTATTAANASLAETTGHTGKGVLVKGSKAKNTRLAYQEMTVPAGWYTLKACVQDATEAGATSALASIGYVPCVLQAEGYYKVGDYSYLKGDDDKTYYATLSTSKWTELTYTFELKEEAVISVLVMNHYADKENVYNIAVDDVEFRAATEEEMSVAGVAIDAAKSCMYDLSGRRIQNAAKGLYIMNGKKYMVK